MHEVFTYSTGNAYILSLMQLLFWPSLELCKRCTLMKNGGVQVDVSAV